jgi:energy-coupling factor transporter ATP-binding protein EcfA2
MTEKDTFLEFIETSLKQLTFHKQISIECEVDEIMLDLHDKTRYHCEVFKQIVTERELTINYIKQFQNDLTQTLNCFSYRQQPNLTFIQPQNKKGIKQTIENQILPLEKQLNLLQFNLEFFKKLNFFNSNIVAIGANGSGKTTLSNDLKKYLPNTGVVISAQKVLIIPTFSGISNIESTNQKLNQTQTADKSLKTTYSTESNGNAYGVLVQLGGEFQILLDNLLADRSAVRNKFCDALTNGGKEINVPQTKLDKTLQIWNSLIQHRTIECNDGINITLKSNAVVSYPAFQMSDGEKVILYLIAHVLQAPTSGFIIIDEPEMYLHKTILNKLWDILERERQDSIFVYLTHDLDFATSRTTAKKVWIRGFTHPDKWEIENIPENDLPETLLLELLGSRKNILFCEGKKGSIDEKIYNILFPNYTITPVDSCFSVINYTKAFNKLPSITTKAFGLIDSDHHGIERLMALEPENIYSFSMTEPENLFLDETFLKKMAKQLLHNESIVDSIKTDIVRLLEAEIELQVSNYVSTKINYYFKDSHVSKGNTLTNVNENYSKFTSEIKIDEWYNLRRAEIEKIITNKNYSKTLSLFNNKGLKAIANRHFKISDFADKAVRLLQFQTDTHEILLKYFPDGIKNKNGL